MVKTIIFIIIAIVLSAFAAIQFAAQLEAVSATKARADENKPTRQLDLGKGGRAVFAGIFFAVMIVLGLLSKISLVSTILALVLSVGMVIANTFFKSIGIGALPTFFVLWIGNLISSIKDAGYTTSTTGWGKIYVVLQVIALILLLVGTVAGNVKTYIDKIKGENEQADELEKATGESNTVNEDEDEEDDEENDEDGFEKDPFHDEFWNKAIKVVGIVIVIVLALVLGFYLEAKFDFFPPYNF